LAIETYSSLRTNAPPTPKIAISPKAVNARVKLPVESRMYPKRIGEMNVAILLTMLKTPKLTPATSGPCLEA